MTMTQGYYITPAKLRRVKAAAKFAGRSVTWQSIAARPNTVDAFLAKVEPKMKAAKKAKKNPVQKKRAKKKVTRRKNPAQKYIIASMIKNKLRFYAATYWGTKNEAVHMPLNVAKELAKTSKRTVAIALSTTSTQKIKEVLTGKA